MEQCNAEPCGFRKIVENKAPLMVGVHIDDIVVAEAAFPREKPGGTLTMYTGARSNMMEATNSSR